MTVRADTAFQMRIVSGRYQVFLIRVDGRDVPLADQEPVFTSAVQSRAQQVSDALNNGLHLLITRAVGNVRAKREAVRQAERARRRLEA